MPSKTSSADSREIGSIFARNMSDLTSTRGKKAALSRATGISPVQINRYLKGTIPTASNLTLICNHLKVKQGDLFVDSEVYERRSLDPQQHNTCSRARTVAARSSSLALGLEAGFYYSYFSMPELFGDVVQAPTFIGTDRSGWWFRRYVGSLSRLNVGPSLSVHHGRVLFAGDKIFMQGQNLLTPYEPALSMYRRLPTRILTLAGIGYSTDQDSVALTKIVVMRTNVTKSVKKFMKSGRINDVRELEHGGYIANILRVGEKTIPISF